jgi:hypothetical protein
MNTVVASLHRTCLQYDLRSLQYVDQPVFRWFYGKAPCRWQGRVTLQFEDVPFGSLMPAGSWKHPDRVDWWLRRMRAGRPIPPPVVCRTDFGTCYLFDGNHRHDAIKERLGADCDELPVRVAMLVPKAGYEFRYRYFDTYGTYLLVPSHPKTAKRGMIDGVTPGTAVVSLCATAHQRPLLRAAAVAAGC